MNYYEYERGYRDAKRKGWKRSTLGESYLAGWADAEAGRPHVHPLDTAKVGDGATYKIHTDTQPMTIISRTAKSVTVQEDKATLLNGFNSGEADALEFSPGGFCGHTSGRQRYTFEPNPEGAISKFTRRVLRDGSVTWKITGHRTNSPGCTLRAGRSKHFDYNF